MADLRTELSLEAIRDMFIPATSPLGWDADPADAQHQWKALKRCAAKNGWTIGQRMSGKKAQALKLLAKHGLVKQAGYVRGGRQRRGDRVVYKITDKGRVALAKAP